MRANLVAVLAGFVTAVVVFLPLEVAGLLITGWDCGSECGGGVWLPALVFGVPVIVGVWVGMAVRARMRARRRRAG